MLVYEFGEDGIGEGDVLFGHEVFILKAVTKTAVFFIKLKSGALPPILIYSL